MAKPYYYSITDFSAGQNNAFDPRSLRPYNNDDNIMEGVRIENYEITERGALIVAAGFEKVVSLGVGGEGTYIGSYDYDNDNRYLIAVANDRIFYKRAFTSTIIHDCDEYNSATYGTFTASGDFTSIATDTIKRQRGNGSVKASMSKSSPTGQGKLTVSNLTAVDISSEDKVEIIVFLSSLNDKSTPANADIFTNMKFRLGTDSTNYYEWTSFLNANANAPVADWNGFIFNLNAPNAIVGSPDLSSITFFELEYNYANDAATFTINIDDIRATKESNIDSVIEITNGLWDSAVVEPTIINGLNFSSSKYPWHLIFHNGQQGVKIRQIGAGMLISESNSTAPVKSYICADMAGFLFVANGRTLYYSSAEEEDDFGGGGVIGFTSEIMGIAPTVNKELLVQLRDKKTQAIKFSFDDTNLIYTPVKSDYQNGSGGVSHKSIQNRYNDAISLSTDGVAFFGETEQIPSGNYRVSSLSWQVDPLIRKMNDEYGHISSSYYDTNKKHYGVGIPIGVGVNRPNTIFVYNSRYNSWTYRSGISMNHAVEHREYEDYEIFFVSPLGDAIYKFTNQYNYDGEDYIRRYTTKTFHMDAPLLFKNLEFIEVGGSMPRGTEFYVVVHSDSAQKAFKITDTALLIDSEGGYIGDEEIGYKYFGGDEGDTGFNFFRFYQRIPIPNSIREGREFKFEFYNETSGMPHKIDIFNIKYTYGPEAKVPNKHINSNIDATISL